MSLPVRPCSTNRLKPTGGVICAISTTSTTNMPNQSKSIPAAFTEGSMTEEVSTTIEMPSMKQPRMIYSTVSTATSCQAAKPCSPIHCAMIRGTPVNAIATVRKAAPARMKAIMHEVLVAPITLAWKVLQVSDPDVAASTSAPMTPITAASVGVATPVQIE